MIDHFRYLPKFVPITLKVTESDRPSLEGPEFFYEGIDQGYLKVMSHQAMVDHFSYLIKFVPTIMKVTDNDRPIFGRLGIFCKELDQRYLKVV
jgi:hypothetical protein